MTERWDSKYKENIWEEGTVKELKGVHSDSAGELRCMVGFPSLVLPVCDQGVVLCVGAGVYNNKNA